MKRIGLSLAAVALRVAAKRWAEREGVEPEDNNDTAGKRVDLALQKAARAFARAHPEDEELDNGRKV